MTSIAQRRESYRDELNFAEFPLASLSSSLPKNQKTLEFTDEIFDKAANKRIQRKLTITASDKYGLPTAADDEVILGLIQLSSRSDFADRRVYFTRYDLLKLLDWEDTGRNYQRLEKSLNRWLGVTLYYEKAWWSKEEQSWVNEGFHILDHVQILDQDRQRRSAKKNTAEAGKSSFVWNEIVFNSFKAGYLKQLDFEFFKELQTSVSKRIYRFLDKRFYHRPRLEFDLRTFSCEHIGLAKGYHSGELKRALRPAIKELEERGFLTPMSPEERFVQRARGEWTIVFVRASRGVVAAPKESAEVSALIERGLSSASARKITSTVSREKIQEKIALCDWLTVRNDPRIQKNRAGFLYKAILEDFPLPDDFVSSKAPPRREQKVVRLPVPDRTPPKAAEDRSALDAYWNSLPLEKRHDIEQELVKAAPAFLREQYVAGQKERGLLFQTVRQAIIDDHCRSALKI